MVKKVTDNLTIRIQGDPDKSRAKELTNCLGQGTVYAPTGTGITMASCLEQNMASVEADEVFSDENFTLTPQVGPITLDPLLFVDDMNKTCLDSNESAKMGAAITETLDELKMSAHDEKSGLLIFGKNREKLQKEVDSNPTYIQGFKMGYKDKETYLGMQFSSQGSADSIMLTLEARRLKCYIKAKELKKKLDDDRVAGIGWLATAITIFNASIVSTLTYGCGSWVGMSKRHMDHLEQTHRQSLFTVLDINNRSTYRNLLSICGIMPVNDVVKKLKICFINELIHMKKEGICYNTLTAEHNRGEIKTLTDEVTEFCQYFGIYNVGEIYINPERLKKEIRRSSLNKVWISLITSKKAPWGPNRVEEKQRFYFTLPKHQAKCALLFEIGELNFRTNRKWEALKKFGTLECVVPGCGQDDTLEHIKTCYGYSTKYRDDFSPHEWVRYLSNIDLERFSKYKSSLISKSLQ